MLPQSSLDLKVLLFYSSFYFIHPLIHYFFHPPHYSTVNNDVRFFLLIHISSLLSSLTAHEIFSPWRQPYHATWWGKSDFFWLSELKSLLGTNRTQISSIILDFLSFTLSLFLYCLPCEDQTPTKKVQRQTRKRSPHSQQVPAPSSLTIQTQQSFNTKLTSLSWSHLKSCTPGSSFGLLFLGFDQNIMISFSSSLF